MRGGGTCSGARQMCCNVAVSYTYPPPSPAPPHADRTDHIVYDEQTRRTNPNGKKTSTIHEHTMSSSDLSLSSASSAHSDPGQGRGTCTKLVEMAVRSDLAEEEKEKNENKELALTIANRRDQGRSDSVHLDSDMHGTPEDSVSVPVVADPSTSTHQKTSCDKYDIISVGIALVVLLFAAVFMTLSQIIDGAVLTAIYEGPKKEAAASGDTFDPAGQSLRPGDIANSMLQYPMSAQVVVIILSAFIVLFTLRTIARITFLRGRIIHDTEKDTEGKRNHKRRIVRAYQCFSEVRVCV